MSAPEAPECECPDGHDLAERVDALEAAAVQRKRDTAAIWLIVLGIALGAILCRPS